MTTPQQQDVPFQYSVPAWNNPKTKSPYYTQAHHDFRNKVQAFVDKEITPYIVQWEEDKDFPMELRQKAVDQGLYGAIWPTQYGGTPPSVRSAPTQQQKQEDHDASHNELDYFNLLIFVDTLSRCGAGGVLWSCFFSFSISLPPVLNGGSQYLKDLVAKDVITGKKQMCLSCTEPSAGSDVSRVQTTAIRKRNAQGEEVFVVNGEKRYITNGLKSHYLTTVVKTERGVSLLLIDREAPGVTTRRQPTQGWVTSNTACVFMQNVEVPVNRLIGEEGQGWALVMSNFNQERLVLATMMASYSRMCLQDTVEYLRKHSEDSKQRVKHNNHVRHLIAEMAAQVEVAYSFLESLAYQFNHGRKDAVAGEIALAKAHCSDVMDFCTKTSADIVGLDAFARGMEGTHRIERLYRETRVNAIGGGSREILLDLAMRQAKL